MTSTADRHTADSITDDALDQLYAERDLLRGFRDVVLLEVEHWDANSLDVLRESVAAALPAPATQETTRG